ncbi:hypothetical protein B0I35DRAFT_510917 [Stachybotrys elegans]|uniref:Uncharacterized protein n=1 Tax=Stachybotrys elegans TaxID=80388 RepID=A0A8K0SZR9_9HYPO|nr:hypothetical protein B0I35DRAFT_510917 [Stachybotrys elegans]
MPGPEKKWDAAAERDLCVALITCGQEGERVRYNWPKVHEFMQEHGYGFSKDAMSQHFTKVILKDFKARHGSTASGPSTPSASKSTPRARKTTTPASKKRSAFKSEPLVDMEDDDDDMETPTKKSRTMKKKDEDDEHFVKLEDIMPQRARSATIADNEAAFNQWMKQ